MAIATIKNNPQNIGGLPEQQAVNNTTGSAGGVTQASTTGIEQNRLDKTVLDDTVVMIAKNGSEYTTRLNDEYNQMLSNEVKGKNNINSLISHFNMARGDYWRCIYYPNIAYDSERQGYPDIITTTGTTSGIIFEMFTYAIRELSLPSRRNNMYEMNINGVKQKVISDYEVDAISITIFNDSKNNNLTELYTIFNNSRIYKAGHILNKYAREYYGMFVIEVIDKSDVLNKNENTTINKYYLHHAFIESIDDVRLDAEGGDLMQITFTLQFSNVITGLYLGNVR